MCPGAGCDRCIFGRQAYQINKEMVSLCRDVGVPGNTVVTLYCSSPCSLRDFLFLNLNLQNDQGPGPYLSQVEKTTCLVLGRCHMCWKSVVSPSIMSVTGRSYQSLKEMEYVNQEENNWKLIGSGNPLIKVEYIASQIVGTDSLSSPELHDHLAGV